MKGFFPIVFASIAAIGNAMFALGQKKSAGATNGLVFVSGSALVAFALAFIFTPCVGALDVANVLKVNWKTMVLSGVGLFFTYFGFNLLYSRYGASQYALYAVISIITTTVIVGVLWLKEPVNSYHAVTISLAITAVILFSIGQSKL